MSLEGGVALAQALESNTILLTLKLHDNFLSEGAGRIMTESFLKNNKLITIDIGGNQLDHATMKKLKGVCQRNRNLKKSLEVAPLKEEIARLKQEQVSNIVSI